MKCGGRTSLFGYTLPRNGALELWDTETWHLRSSAPGNSRRRPRSIVWVVDAPCMRWCQRVAVSALVDLSYENMPEEEAPKLRLISAGLHSDVTEWDVETLEPIETCSPGALAVLKVGAFQGSDSRSRRSSRRVLGKTEQRRRCCLGTRSSRPAAVCCLR